MRQRVLTLNVQSDTGGRERSAAINAELRRLAPDVVALQEVRYPIDGWNQLAEILAGTGLAHATHQADVLPGLPDHFAHDGTAIATRRPHRVADVRESTEDPHWWTLAVAVELPGFGDQLVITPTTPWRLDHAAARERQLLDLTELDARHRTDVPSLIAGDLNAAPDSAGIRYLCGLQSLHGRSAHYVDAWTTADRGPGHTWTTGNPLGAAEIRKLLGQSIHHRRIDYIFTGSSHTHAIRAEVTNASLVGTDPPQLSDHYGVVADLELYRR
ncbi:endonuclease/exonuclease/phosphatase family metal-dependent hydrolase [Kribbella amoyensis]|uniref:Endonuclease/exonuclease/phosphatase family metal-dependent hydrolase n=1 Tax=Kribbella amoyensis TaxID=996641 RepID=A0A561BQ69_9ACTN|nr:endonuclease/exonuclease/phosphatase family protein [Kribbella amoyensis]TWD80963.1 endonuclease/exonuclease/phosphatase family metal-dependent hydrolase [Kribbella amoyensis]